MKATELAKAFNEIDDAYLAELDTSEKERITMKNRKKFSRILIAAAVICLLSITAFAAEQARIHSFTSGNQEYQESYNALAQAMEDAGFRLTLPGLLSGVVLSFIPSMGLFFIADILGGNKIVLVGSVIQEQITKGRNQPFAAALSAVLMVLTSVMIRLYRKITGTSQLEGMM